MAGRKSGEESKVREYILVPSFKLGALEKADAESAGNVPQTHSNLLALQQRNGDFEQKGSRTSGSDKHGIRVLESSKVQNDEEDTEWETTSGMQDMSTEESGNGTEKKRRGNSLADRRKRLRLLWLDL